MATNLVAEIAELLSPNIVSSIASAFGLNSGKAAPSAPPPQQIPDVGGGLATYCGIPGQTGPTGQTQSPQTQSPMGDIFGQILRDLLSGKGGQLKPASLAGGMGSAVFGDRLEAGQDVDPAHLRSMQEVLDRFNVARM